jgi:hypothetical protein
MHGSMNVKLNKNVLFNILYNVKFNSISLNLGIVNFLTNYLLGRQ